MDDLDHLFVQLVEHLRDRRPGRLTDAIALRELYGDLIPYQQVRDAIGFRSNADYEAALSRLIAGERAYLLSDAHEMRSAVREGLSETIPDLRRYRAYPDAQLRLNPEQIPPPGDRRYAPPELRRSVIEEEPPTADDRFNDDGPAAEAPSASAGSERANSEPSPAGAEPEEPNAGASPVGAVPEESDAGVPSGAAESERHDGEPQDAPLCRVCGDGLPERELRFCPFCGAAQDRDVCAGCGTELEGDWRFCPDCGRSREDEPPNE